MPTTVTKRSLIAGAFALAVVLSLGADGCPPPTKSTFTNQRKVPMFSVLAYEHMATAGGNAVMVFLFEDEAGGCYITSGTDGGITELRTRTACDHAKKPNLETK